MRKFALLVGCILAVTGCETSDGSVGGSGGGGTAGSAGSGGSAGSAGAGGSGGDGGTGGTPMCVDDGDCDEMNECRVNGTCNLLTGMCEGASDQPLDTDCTDGGSFCDGAGSCVECNDVSQCTDDGNECTVESCDLGSCSSSDEPNNTACDFGGAAGLCWNGTCVDAANCMPADKCDDLDDCTVDICDPFDGSCTNDNEPDDTVCNDAPGDLPGTCLAGICIGLCEGVDCDIMMQCTMNGVCNTDNGICEGETSEPIDTDCTEGGGSFCDGAGTCVECNSASQCPDDGNECTEDPQCNSNACGQPNKPLGEPCSIGECDGMGTCAAPPPAPVTQDITLGCTNNLTTDVSILPWELEAAPRGAMIGGGPVAIDYTGVAFFTESFLDAGLAAVPGLDQAALQQGNRGGATIVPKAGLIGPNVEIEPAPIPLTCDGGMNAGGSCVVSSECPPVGYFNCTEVVLIPTIDGTGDACAACDALGSPKDTQCADNGFCIAPGGLPIPLDNVTGNYTVGASGTVLLGWDETNQNGTNVDGTYVLFPASFGAPWQPGGLRVVVGVLQIALNCVMAVDSGGPDGVGVPDQASPTPDANLTSFDIL